LKNQLIQGITMQKPESN